MKETRSQKGEGVNGRKSIVDFSRRIAEKILAKYSNLEDRRNVMALIQDIVEIDSRVAVTRS